MLIDELVAAFIGGSLPTLRGRPVPEGEKSSANFYFQVIRPDALDAGLFAGGRSQKENVKAVMDDIMGHGNEAAMWPGQIEAEAAALSRRAGGLLFTAAEIASFAEIAAECGHPSWDVDSLAQYEG
jgi:L-2-hydroxycarboxylate dehydrogenase (NAD+)